MSKSDFILLFGNQIGYTSVLYYLFLPAAVIAYYLIPKKHRWLALLGASALFYYLLFSNRSQKLVFSLSIVISWVGGLILGKLKDSSAEKRSCALAVSIILSALPLILMDGDKMLMSATGDRCGIRNLIIPLGISFYTLQIIAYLADIYTGKAEAQKNILKYTLFVSFFPQLIQGPISRYNKLSHQLTNGNDFDPDNIGRGFRLILWGMFLKMMIADKAGIVVDTIFENSKAYRGAYSLIGGILYSIQLYADFHACTTLSQGAAYLFGIQLPDNFNHPYFSTSIKDFWRRWHMSLSFWLRDYIYIPLGGNRKGKARKYLNLIITFLVSGIWHGGTMKFVFWGLLHAAYQLIGGWTYKLRNRIWLRIGVSEDSKTRKAIQIISTFILVMFGGIIFRADHLREGVFMIRSIFTEFSPWVLTGTYLFHLGLDQNECFVLLVSILILFFGSRKQEQGMVIGDRIASIPIVWRYALYLLVIAVISIFGTYGFGFNAQDFIYGGF